MSYRDLEHPSQVVAHSAGEAAEPPFPQSGTRNGIDATHGGYYLNNCVLFLRRQLEQRQRQAGDRTTTEVELDSPNNFSLPHPLYRLE